MTRQHSRWRPADALARAGRRWVSWRFLAIPFALACAIGVFILFEDVSLRAQLLFASKDAFFCTPTRIASIVLFFALIGPAVSAGFIIANILLWLIPKIRHVLESADARTGQSFSKVTASLTKAFVILAATLLPIVVLALNSKVCLSPSAVYYRPHLMASSRSYSLSQIANVLPACWKSSRGGWNFGLSVMMDDDTSLDLASIEPWFRSSSEQILATLRERPRNDSHIDRHCPDELRRLISPVG